MSKKRIISIIMLVVLAAGIVLAVYGATGVGIYDNAAAMLGGDKKAAIGYIQDPSTLTEPGCEVHNNFLSLVIISDFKCTNVTMLYHHS